MTSRKQEPSVAPPSLWRPLRTPIFRSLLIADFVSDLGTFMQNVGAAWLMLSFGSGPLYVALTQTASTLPYFLFALPAGALGDIVDRRKLVLFTECWMLGVALVLAVATIAGLMSPWLLLLLTFLLSGGDAFEAPSWRAILPELVQREDLATASALSGIEFNLARAVGPALAGAVIAAVGVAAAFFLNAASFFGVLFVIWRWKRPVRQSTVPAESVGSATVVAIRYVRYSPAIRKLLVRTGSGMFFASAFMALLPSIAHRVNGSAASYGVLLACFGSGAIAGAMAIQRLRSRVSSDGVVSGGMITFGVILVALGRLHGLVALSAAMLVGGGAWIVVISLLSTLMQNLAPDWVRARVLAVQMLVLQGSIALGSAVWGMVAQRAGLDAAFLVAGIGTAATSLLGIRYRLPDADLDLSVWNHWRMPVPAKENEPDLDEGPVLVIVEYLVDAEHAADFVMALHRFERVRRRDGASSWGIFQDTETPDRYLETFLVPSWAEHLRQHERLTVADRGLQEKIGSFARAEPNVRHLIYARRRKYS